jgi:hypothetical protein
MTGRYSIILSGQATSDSYAFSPRINVIDHDDVVVGVECLGGNSGVSWTIQGYLMPATKVHSIGSGSLTSGGYTRVHSGLNLNESIKVGVANLVAGESGVVSVYALQKRGVA